jgi:hypothetical protein
MRSARWTFYEQMPEPVEIELRVGSEKHVVKLRANDPKQQKKV